MVIRGDALSDAYNEIKSSISELNNSDISDWLSESELDTPLKVSTKGGWIKHAFVF